MNAGFPCPYFDPFVSLLLPGKRKAAAKSEIKALFSKSSPVFPGEFIFSKLMPEKIKMIKMEKANSNVPFSSPSPPQNLNLGRTGLTCFHIKSEPPYFSSFCSLIECLYFINYYQLTIFDKMCQE